MNNQKADWTTMKSSQEGITTTEAELAGMMVMDPRTLDDLHHGLHGNLFADRDLGHICDSILNKHRSGVVINYSSVSADLSPHLADTLQHACSMYATSANAYYCSESVVCAGLRREMSKNLELIAQASRAHPGPDGNNQTALEDLLFTTEELLNRTKDSLGGVKDGGGVNAEAGAELILKIAEDGRTGKNFKIKTGVYPIDELTGGIRPGTVWAVGARPGVGKSVMLWQIAVKAAEQGRRALVVTAEMGASGYFLRFVAARAGLPSRAIEDGKMKDHEWITLSRACSNVAKYGDMVTVWDHLGSNMEVIMPALQRKVKAGEVDLILIDFIQRFNAGRLAPRGANRNTELEVISRALADLAHVSDVPVVLASQFRRDKGEWTRPNMSWFRDCGSLEQDCDVALLLYRPDPDDALNVEAIIDKNRQGEVGSRSLAFDPAKMAFRPLVMRIEEGGE